MSLPIDSVLPQLCAALAEHHQAVLVAAPGAGKTTTVPLVLLRQPWLGQRKILVLEPRRLAARTAATRMAQLLGEAVGETVGYRMRLDTRESARSRIIVVTEGVLTRMLQADPSLDQFGIVIFDEFHERSLDADLGLALTLYSRALFRDDAPLKVLVMSATLDAVGVAQLLEDAPVIQSEGRSFAVDIRYGSNIDARDIVDACAQCITDSVARNEGSVLAFLPGQREIRAVESLLRQKLPATTTLIAPLYGDLTLEQQQRAIAPADRGITKIVLATNIAETSITIDGVCVVVDCGFERAPQFDARTAMTRLATQRISRASATQRAGRAGRLMPGICYRLWSAQSHATLAEFGTPEIRNTDLAQLALQLLFLGVTPAELRWLDAPPASAYQQALDLLRMLRACENTAQHCAITPHGARMAAIPLPPRLSHMLVRASQMGLTTLGCELAALLSDRDPLSRSGGRYGCDLVARIEWLRGDIPADQTTRAQLQRLRQLAKDFARHVSDDDSTTHIDPTQALNYLGILVALAYPDRIAQQRAENAVTYRLGNGRSASLADNDTLRNQRMLAIADVGGVANTATDRIFLACRFDAAWLDTQRIDMPLRDAINDLVEQRTVIEWQEGADQLTAERQHCIGALILKREKLTDISAQQRSEAVIGWIRQRGIGVLPWNHELRNWQARVLCLRNALPQANPPWPDISDAALLASLEQWLAPYLNEVRHIRHVSNVDLKSALQSLLPWPLPAQLDQLAPTHYTVPTGSNIRIDYTQQPPVLAVKLQEMFGEKTTPAIADGRVQLLLHLLSPAQRPLAITQDLVSFWRNAYPEVKKDMKGRYPRHPWPDDPLAAPPARGTKKREGY